jgi:TetR/AcrR family transcriptional regulator, cholesterol catabolism regulator
MEMIAAPSKKTIILQESAKLFREKGFGNASMRDIAERVGMEAASLYNHIANKDSILYEICQQIADTYLSDLSYIEQLPISYADKIKAIISSHIKAVKTSPDGVSVVNHDWKYLSEEKRKSFFSQRRNYEARIEHLILEGIEAQEFKKVDPRISMLTLLSSIRWIEFAAKATPEYPLTEIEHQINLLILGGLKK